MGRHGAGHIEYCLNNVTDLSRSLLCQSGLSVEESSCLQRCGRCYAGPFLVVDGVLLVGVSHADLLERLSGRDSVEEEAR